MSFLPSFILGYHGCNKKIGLKIVNKEIPHRYKNNSYDWLGNGLYFWENNPQRAFEFATELSTIKRPSRLKINIPFVIGAIIDPGNCFDLLDSNAISILKQAYKVFIKKQKMSNFEMPKNKSLGTSGDLLLRNLDCAVIECMHTIQNERNHSYDTVRGAFWEGTPIYPGAGIRSKSHVQLCVRNPACIKGYFLPSII